MGIATNDRTNLCSEYEIEAIAFLDLIKETNIACSCFSLPITESLEQAKTNTETNTILIFVAAFEISGFFMVKNNTHAEDDFTHFMGQFYMRCVEMMRWFSR